MSEAHELIERLGLAPHPEGGWYRELYRSPMEVTGPRGRRCALTTIYYLLEQRQVSRWHRVAADEAWHFYAGAPLELACYDPVGSRLEIARLGPPEDGHPAVHVVPPSHWQAARTAGPYSLVGCSVAPGFEFADFEMVAQLAGHAAHFSGALHAWRQLL